MIHYISNFLGRFRVLRNTILSNGARCVFHNRVKFIVGKNSKLILKKGFLRIGFPLPGTIPFATFPESVVALGENSELICDDTVIIAPGASIRISDGAKLHFKGRNVIAHNLTLLCSKQVTLGFGTSLSWFVTLVDDDKHRFFNQAGKQMRNLYRTLEIGEWVGLQMNVTVPRGLKIGNHAVVAAGTVVRQDIPESCLAYGASDLRFNYKVRTPTELEQQIALHSTPQRQS